MAQEYKSAGIIGAGPAGCICAYYLLNAGIDVTLFDISEPLKTLLPTGGGRCNLSHAEYDLKELAKNYPRGEKFLYSVFSRFSVYDTIELFEKLGIKTYTQDDSRIFPISNSSKIVRECILKNISKANIVRERVMSISDCKIKTNKAEYLFSDIVISTGGRKFTIEGIDKHRIIPFRPSLVGLKSEINSLGGITLKNIYSNDYGLIGDILFTHYGISGPLIYKISSLKAMEEFPYTLSFDLYNEDFNLQSMLDQNSHKDIKNIISKELHIPINFVKYLLKEKSDMKGFEINGKLRDEIINKIHNFEVKIFSADKGEETVSAGGIDLKEINPKTMESLIYPNIYFIGEVLNIDGFCGGFNLQNCWSTAFIASESIKGGI